MFIKSFPEIGKVASFILLPAQILLVNNEIHNKSEKNTTKWTTKRLHLDSKENMYCRYLQCNFRNIDGN